MQSPDHMEYLHNPKLCFWCCAHISPSNWQDRDQIIDVKIYYTKIIVFQICVCVHNTKTYDVTALLHQTVIIVRVSVTVHASGMACLNVPQTVSNI